MFFAMWKITPSKRLELASIPDPILGSDEQSILTRCKYTIDISRGKASCEWNISNSICLPSSKGFLIIKEENLNQHNETQVVTSKTQQKFSTFVHD